MAHSYHSKQALVRYGEFESATIRIRARPCSRKIYIFCNLCIAMYDSFIVYCQQQFIQLFLHILCIVYIYSIYDYIELMPKIIIHVLLLTL